jgi:hypothetical protein
MPVVDQVRDRVQPPPARARGPQPVADARPGPGADTHAFEVSVPRQAGPVSAPFTSPAPRAPSHDDQDHLTGSAEDEPQAYDQPRTSVRERDDAPSDAAIAFGLDKGAAAGTDIGPRPERAVPAERPRPGTRRGQPDPKPGRRSGFRVSPKARLWTCAGVALTAAVASVALALLHSGPGGPDHTLVTPAKLGDFTRNTQLTKQMDVTQLERNIVAQSSGQASHLVSAVYQAGSPVSGGSPTQVMLFIGGRLSGAAPKASVKSFTQHFKDASMTSAGSLGGQAACVSAQSGTDGSTVCAWFDNDTFGELVSPNMSVSVLANEMRTIRPSVELVVKK